MAIDYDDFLEFLKSSKKYKINSKKNYFIIWIPKMNYHLTIFRDQWEDYFEKTGMDCHLFHFSSNQEENRCSSYFWIDRTTYNIIDIPKKNFKYEQDDYGLESSTRKSCPREIEKKIVYFFQNIIDEYIAKKLHSFNNKE